MDGAVRADISYMDDTWNEEVKSFRSEIDDRKNDEENVVVWRVPPEGHDTDTVLRNKSRNKDELRMDSRTWKWMIRLEVEVGHQNQ
jgi:hypothetical protein